MQIDDKRTSNRILEWRPIGTRIRGRPRRDGLKTLKKKCKQWQ